MVKKKVKFGKKKLKMVKNKKFSIRNGFYLDYKVFCFSFKISFNISTNWNLSKSQFRIDVL